MIKKKLNKLTIVALILAAFLVGCSSNSANSDSSVELAVGNKAESATNGANTQDKNSSINTEGDSKEDTVKNDAPSSNDTVEDSSNTNANPFPGYKLIEVAGGDTSGNREPNVVVDIGFGDREYYAFTNEYGQLVKVAAKKIVLQDDSTEPVTSSGRYYADEAKVPGVESKTLDEGHVIADSLGGVSNAYNITPQNSTLNRHGDQAYMEKVIRDAGGCTDFVAIITYPNTTTQIPSHYSYTYTIKGNVINDEFDNVNPDEYNASLEATTPPASSNNNSGSSSNDTSTETTTPPTNNSNNGAIVYWTPNGKSYHTRKNCSTLSRSKTILEGTLQQSGKADPCDVCN